MRSIVFAALVLLAQPLWAKEKLQVPSLLVQTHGYVYAGFPKGGASPLAVRPVQGGKEILIDTLTEGAPLAGAQAVSKWLPAGTYRVSGWNGGQWTDGPIFQVQAGWVTQLGDFLPVNIGGYELVLLPVRNKEHAGGLAAATRAFRNVLLPEPTMDAPMTVVPPPVKLPMPGTGLGLIADLLLAHDRKINKPSTLAKLKATRDPQQFLQTLRTITPPLQDEPAFGPDGVLYFGADFGQVRKRAADGSWSNFGSDSLRQILAVEYADGRLLTDSDDGHVRATTDEGAHWSELHAFKRGESVIDIDRAEGTWVVVTSERFDDPDAPRSGGMLAAPPGTASAYLRVYVGHADDFSDLQLSREVKLSPKDQILWMGAHGAVANGYFYITIAPNLHRLQLATGEWKIISPDSKVGTHRVDPDTGVISTLWAQGAFSKVFVSSNHGDSWTQIGRPPYAIADVQMDSREQGWASRWNANAFSGAWELYSFSVAKNDWDLVGEAPFNCKPLRVAKDVAPLCIGNDASIFGQRGRRWEVEFSAL